MHGAGGANADARQLVCSDGLNLGGVEGHVIEALVADALGTELGDVGYDANPQRLLECLQGDAAGNAQRRREAAREVAAAGDVMVVAIANIGGRSRHVRVGARGEAPRSPGCACSCSR